MTGNEETLRGITTEEAKKRLDLYGKNELAPKKEESFIKKILKIIREPMFLLLIISAVIYFILGEPRDGSIMLIFVVGIISIEVIQEWKTDKTLSALSELSSPRATVIRDGVETEIASFEIVPGDIMIIYEGVKIPADGFVIKCSDLCIDESLLTGESEVVWKHETGREEDSDDGYWRKDCCYAGTLVIQGNAYVRVEKTGVKTEYGKIGLSVALAPKWDTPLKKQTDILVKTCALIAAALFILVSVITWFNIPEYFFKERFTESILSGITLAMAMIPEEFPVILTVFLSMGAWRLAKKNSLVRSLPAVETLGALSVLCVDKTGTITMNQMSVQSIWPLNGDERELCETMLLACETDAYDPMEKAMLTYCGSLSISQETFKEYTLIKEYSFTNELKMMGHVWLSGDRKIKIAAKGSPESIFPLCGLSQDEHLALQAKVKKMSEEGLRVIAIGFSDIKTEAEIPEKIIDCSLIFQGLIGLMDPPRESVKKDIESCQRAGIRVVMITGDNGITASSIAKRIGMKNYDRIITGEMLDRITDEELSKKVENTDIFSRVIPEHKMRIVKALKENGETVAMTGDGVNDAPALKYADIGIAMGKRGSEVSREAADLILLDDNFSTIVDTVKDGRRIYDNIRRAVGYIFSIHIPIALASLLAPMLGVSSKNLLLLPLHVVLLELIIDPTCSIVLERQPAEENIMEKKPRKVDEKILSRGLIIKSVFQGIFIFAASFGLYWVMLSKGSEAALARSMGLTVIMLANLFLVQVNASEYDFVYTSFKTTAKDKFMRLIGVLTVALIFIIVYTPLNSFLKLAPLSAVQLLIAFSTAAVSVFWYEFIKLFKKCG